MEAPVLACFEMATLSRESMILQNPFLSEFSYDYGYSNQRGSVAFINEVNVASTLCSHASQASKYTLTINYITVERYCSSFQVLLEHPLRQGLQSTVACHRDAG